MIAKGNDLELTGAGDVTESISSLIAPLSREQLESATIDAIREHRAALAKAETAHDEWRAQGAKDPATTSDCPLYARYTKLMIMLKAQRIVLSTLIDQLGYVPKVPAE